MWILNVSPFLALFLTFLAYRITLIIYRLYFHPLAGFPGPKLCAITSLYEFYYDVLTPRGGQFVLKLQSLHAQYGPVIRVTPDDIHVLDPDFHCEVFSNKGKWNKHPQYQRFGNARSHFATLDHDLHRVRRGAIAPFFSKQKVRDLEPRIQRNVERLVGRLKGFEGSEERVKIRDAFAATGKDTVTEYSTGVSANCLSHPTFDRPHMQLIRNMAPLFHLSRQLTFLILLFDKLPSWMLSRLDAEAARYKRMLEHMRSQISAMMEKLQAGEAADAEKAGEHRTVMSEVIGNKLLPEDDITLDRMTEELDSLTIGGTDTMAVTLMVITYHILKEDRSVLRKLRTEASQLPQPWTFTQLEQLPYLTGIIKEGLRLAIGSSLRLGRIAPDREIVYPGASQLGKDEKQWVIPRGTEISMNSVHTHHDKRVWGDDPLKFVPERWETEAERKRLGRYITSFQAGTRGCLGLNLAYAELYLIIANVFVKADFELEMHDPRPDDMDVLGNMVQPLIRKEVEVYVKPRAKA